MKNISNERCSEILKILIDRQEPITINEIANRLDVSNRTIRNDFQKISELLEDSEDIKIVKKPRVGVWLDANFAGKKKIESIISSNEEYIHPYSSKVRKRYIIERLLMSQDSVTMQKLGNELYVSRITIYNDCEEVEKWLKKYNLLLRRKKNYGVEVVGAEMDFRKAISDLMNINLRESQKRSNVHKEDGSIHVDIQHMFKKDILEKIKLILTEIQSQMAYKFTDEAYSGLVMHIAIALDRLKNENPIVLAEFQKKEIQEKNEYEIAKTICSKMNKLFKVNFSEDEIANIALHVLGSKIRYIKDESLQMIDEIDDQIVDITKEIISLIEKILSVDFSNDKKLFIGLLLHLRTAINRMKYGLNIRNPLLKDIKHNYPSVFGAAWASSVLFEKYFGIKVTEEEIGFISIHIGAALERLNEKTRAVIVCSSGIGTAGLVAVRLEREISGLDIVEITSVNDIDSIKSTDFDIIISTLPFEYISKPVIQINPIVTKKDLEEVKKYLVNIQNTRRFIKNKMNDQRSGLFDEKFVFAKTKASSKTQIINDLCRVLINEGYVKEEFLKFTLEREQITSTAVGKGVAIPHGSHIYVNEPVIVVATLDEPVEWLNGKVDIVFLLALKFDNKEKIRYFFKNFYSMLDNDEILNAIRHKEKSKEIYEILLGNNIFED